MIEKGVFMFFGREKEISQLSDLWHKRVASLVTCRGRRRIGKSALIEEFAHRTDARFIKIEGKRPQKGWSIHKSGIIVGVIYFQNLLHRDAKVERICKIKVKMVLFFVLNIHFLRNWY